MAPSARGAAAAGCDGGATTPPCSCISGDGYRGAPGAEDECTEDGCASTVPSGIGTDEDSVDSSSFGSLLAIGAAAASSGGRDGRLPQQERQPVPSWSSGVPFYPPSAKFWRIGGRWYDFADFLDKHPGGRQVLLVTRDRFEDCTFVFESHHHNYRRARAVIKRYEVSDADVTAEGVQQRPRREEKHVNGPSVHYDVALERDRCPTLLDDEAFYSVLRLRVAEKLRAEGHPDGGPTLMCVWLFWTIFAMWAASWIACLRNGQIAFAVVHGLFASLLGAFGHNWVHQPKYKLWAYLSLDTIGFSSNGWFREHNLQHHMYTNTPWDNHFRGTEPFLVTDPTVERNKFQALVTPYLNPLVLIFGLPGNYIAHAVEMAKGNEIVTPWKLAYPLQWVVMVGRWGSWGVLVQCVMAAVLGVWYFTLALMNHNSERSHDVDRRNASRDWGEAQLNSSADWAVGSSFLGASRFLWLNFHTVHHLFPRLDFSHHPMVQGILVGTCAEFGIEYSASDFVQLYREMLHCFSEPRSLLTELVVYAGGI